MIRSSKAVFDWDFLYQFIDILQQYLGECGELLGSVLKDGASAEELDFEDVEKACVCFLVTYLEPLNNYLIEKRSNILCYLSPNRGHPISFLKILLHTMVSHFSNSGAGNVSIGCCHDVSHTW